MKALAVTALVFAGLSIFIPVVGVFLAMLCSLLALVAFRTEPTLSGITFGLNIVSTAFLTPSIVVAEVVASSNSSGTLGTATQSAPSTPGSIYLFYVGFHVVFFCIAIAWRLLRGASK